MKAAILAENFAPLVVADVALSERLEFGQVLVRVCYSGICGAQINEIDAVKGPDKFLPHLLGHEGSGIVEKIGAGVTRVTPGDPVILHWRQAAGIQSQTPAYRWDGRNVNAGWVTTFNEQAVVSENRLTPVPKDFDLSVAPLFGCAVTTGLSVVNNDAHLKIGESIVVFGAGGVGLNVIQGADLVSAYPVVAVDLQDHRLEAAGRFGATHRLHSKDPALLREEILKIVGPEGVDVAVETTGQARMIELAYELTKPQGRAILVGVPRKGDNISIYSLPLHFKKVLKGSHGGDARPDAEIPRYINLHRIGRLKLAEQITHRFPLDRINEAIETVRGGKVGRCVLDISPL